MVSQTQVGYSRDNKGFIVKSLEVKMSWCLCFYFYVLMGLEIVAQVIRLPTMYEALGSIPRCGSMLL